MSKSLVCNKLRLEGKLCDAVIRVDEVEFPVHKIIMCDCSQYFRALFADWNHPRQGVFTIHGVPADKMGDIIEFAYTGSVTLSSSSILQLTMMADFFNFCELLKTCTDFLRDQLSPSNCIQVLQLTETCYLPDLQSVVLRFICTHYTGVMSHEGFLELDAQHLALILDRDDLDVSHESVLFTSIMRWIAHMPEERQGNFSMLFSKMRLGLLTHDQVVSLLEEELVCANYDNYVMVIRAAVDIYQLNIHRSEPGILNAFCRPRLPTTLLLATGGWNATGPSDEIEIFDYATNWWMTVPKCSMMHPVAYHGTAFLDGHLYTMGGMTRVDTLNTMYRFDPVMFTWQELSPMYQQRCYLCVAVLNESIYAIGGFNGFTRSSTAERYQRHTNQWTLIAPMHAQRSDASCATLNNQIYICGGFTGSEILQTAERYNPETNQWTMITPMIRCRSGVGLTAYMGRIFAVGGFNGTNRLNSAEAYDPVTNSWHEVRNMMYRRSNFGIAVTNGQLYVVGGFSKGLNFQVESYDGTTNSWSTVARINTPRSALSCCVIYGLCNMEKYCIPRDDLPLCRRQPHESIQTRH